MIILVFKRKPTVLMSLVRNHLMTKTVFIFTSIDVEPDRNDGDSDSDDGIKPLTICQIF